MPEKIYDEMQKTWKSLGYKYEAYTKQSIGEAFLKQMKIVPPDQVLEQHYDLNVKRTAMEIHRDALTAAINLKRMGLQQGDIIACYSNATPELSALSMGAFCLGIGVAFFDTKFNIEQALYMLQLLQPTLLLYEEQFYTKIMALRQKWQPTQLKYTISIDGTSIEEHDTVAQTVLQPVEETLLTSFQLPTLGDSQQVIAMLLLTSGSTGMPKAVALSHATVLHGTMNFWHTDEQQHELLPKNAVLLSISPQRWVTQIMLMMQSLLLGVCRICAIGEATGVYGRELIRQTGVTHFVCTPLTIQNILLALDETHLKALHTLSRLFIIGEAASDLLLSMARKMLPKCSVYRSYGMTEFSGTVANDLYVNGGHLCPGYDVQILNDNLQPLGPNEFGQLCVRAPQSYLGYYNIDNTQTFYANGYFNTGDYAFMDNQQKLHIVGRYKDLVRTKHTTLIPSFVERLVCTLPDVFAAVLVGYRPNADANDDIGALYVVPQDKIWLKQSAKLKQKIRELLKQELHSAEEQIIKDIYIIEQHPLASSGKLDKNALITNAKQAAENQILN